MTASFTDYLRSRTALSDPVIDHIISVASKKMVRRNDFLFNEGEVCKHKAFVVRGLLRTFAIAADGNEHTIQFSPENTWTLDAESYDQQVPSAFNIAAVEESEILLWHKPDFDKLLADIPALKSFAEQLISRTVYNTRQRLLTALSATPEQKYTDFIREHPSLMARLPLRMISSYLGISLKTLTRIRHAQMQRFE